MYENSMLVNPSIRNFWRNLKKNDSHFHVFKKNKNLVFFGDELSCDSYNFVSNRIKELKINYDLTEISTAYLDIIKNESGHEDSLKELAIKAVSETFESPEELFSAEINEDSVDSNSTEEKFNDVDYESLDNNLKSLINKRILHNCLIQGASIHAFCTLHHYVKNEINTLDDSLIKLYDQFSVGSLRSYFSVDYSNLLKNKAFSEKISLGSAKVDFDQENNVKVVAKAKTFPVLCQELIKGAMEVICLHGLEDISKDDLAKIYKFADARADEPRYIQISSEVWRRFLDFKKHYQNVNEKVSIPDLILKIVLIKEKLVEDFFEFLFQKDYDKCLEFLDDWK